MENIFFLSIPKHQSLPLNIFKYSRESRRAWATPNNGKQLNASSVDLLLFVIHVHITSSIRQCFSPEVSMDVPWMCHGCNNLAGHCCPLAHEYQTRVFHENVATDLVRMSRWPSQTIWLRSNSWKMTNWCRPMRRLYICTAAAVFISWTRVHYTTRLVAWNFSKWKRNASCQIDNHRRQMSVTGRKTESMQQTSTHKSIWLNISHRTASVSLTVLQPAKYFACL